MTTTTSHSNSSSFSFSLMAQTHSVRYFVVIVNPVSGEGSALQFLEQVKPIFETNNNIKLIVHCTTHKGHATKIVGDIILTGISGIIVIGGDGTLSEVINGMLVQRRDGIEVPLGIIPAGSNNTVCEQLYGPNCLPIEAAQHMIESPIVKIEVPRIRYVRNSILYDYYINSYLTCGMVPHAIDSSESWRWAGSLRYAIGFSVEAFFPSSPHSTQVILDSNIINDGPILLLVAGVLIDPDEYQRNKNLTVVIFDVGMDGLAAVGTLTRLLKRQPLLQEEKDLVRVYHGMSCQIRSDVDDNVAVDGEIGVVRSTYVMLESNVKQINMFGKK